jgi:hypothetical protein
MIPPGGNERLSTAKTSSYFAFTSLRLPTVPARGMTFTVDTVPVMDDPPASADQFPLWYTRPDAQILTLAPSAKDLEALAVNGVGVVEFFYRIKYASSAAQPVFYEGSYEPNSTDAGVVDSADYFPLPQLGIKLFLPRYALSVEVAAVGSGHATATTWANEVRIGAQITPAAAKGHSSNFNRAPLAQAGGARSFMPRFAHTITVPSLSGGAGTFSFRNLGRATVATYPTGPGPVPIPPDALSVIASGPGFFAGYDCY